MFWFFLKGEEFVSRTINDSDIELDKFAASKVRQLAKKVDSSKSTAKHIKHVSNEPQATQIHLQRHQCTELPPNKYQRKKRKSKPGLYNYKYQQKERKIDRHHKNMKNTDKKTTNKKKDVTNVVTHLTLKVLDVLPVDIDANTAVRQDTLAIYVSERNKKVHTGKIQESQRHTNYKVESMPQ